MQVRSQKLANLSAEEMETITLGRGQFDVIRDLDPNDYFGEVSILCRGYQRTCSVISQNYSNLSFLQKNIFFYLCEKYPVFERILRWNMFHQYDDSKQMFLRSCLKQIPYL